MRLYVSDLLIRLRFRVFHVRNDVVIIARQCRTQKNNTQQLTLPLWFWVCVCVCVFFFLYIFHSFTLFWKCFERQFQVILNFYTKRGTLIAIFWMLIGFMVSGCSSQFFPLAWKAYDMPNAVPYDQHTEIIFIFIFHLNLFRIFQFQAAAFVLTAVLPPLSISILKNSTSNQQLMLLSCTQFICVSFSLFFHFLVW